MTVLKPKKPYFSGKTIIITGASRGIGREIALILAKDHANIVILAKTRTKHKSVNIFQ